MTGAGTGPRTVDRALTADRQPLPLVCRLSSLEQALFADAADGRLDAFSLLEAGLIASGVEEPGALVRYAGQLDAWIAELRRAGSDRHPPRQQARAIFDFLHRRVLTGGYCLQCTDLREAIDHGRFNCVSATVLFNCLAGGLGLRACGLEIPGHAMSRIQWLGGSLDVETTCPRWFQLIDDPKKQAELVEKTLGRLLSKDCRSAREVSPVALIAMIYYNRGVDLLCEKRFAEAAAVNAKAIRLDPSNATARGNFLATINNWAIELGGSGHYSEAAELLRLGRAIDPSYEVFTWNYVHLCRQWADHLSKTGHSDQALRLLARLAAEQPDEAGLGAGTSGLQGRARQVGGPPAP